MSRPDRTAKILRVNYMAGSKEEAVRTVRGITDSYNEFLEESYKQEQRPGGPAHRARPATS